MTAQTFKREIAASVLAYEKFVVCLEKTPEDFEDALASLMAKAIKAYVTRGEGMRHGIALDQQVTIILSQSDGDRPLCGIYFNLHSAYYAKENNSPNVIKSRGKRTSSSKAKN